MNAQKNCNKKVIVCDMSVFNFDNTSNEIIKRITLISFNLKISQQQNGVLTVKIVD